MKQIYILLFAGDPIKCWVPQHFTGSHTKFTNAYCWVKNTYYLPFDEYIPDETTYAEEIEGDAELPYYQWLPFIMLGQVSICVMICSVCLAEQDSTSADLGPNVSVNAKSTLLTLAILVSLKTMETNRVVP